MDAHAHRVSDLLQPLQADTRVEGRFPTLYLLLCEAEALCEGPLGEAGCDAGLDQRKGQVEQSLDVTTTDPPVAKVLIPLDLGAQLIGFAFQGFTHRCVYPRSYSGARLACGVRRDGFLEAAQL